MFDWMLAVVVAIIALWAIAILLMFSPVVLYHTCSLFAVSLFAGAYALATLICKKLGYE